MEKSLLKDSVRQIKNTFKRFLSIVAIVLLGVGFFAGITATSPDMKDTIDTYFDDEDVMDIEVISTLGLTDEDDVLSKVKDFYREQGIDIPEFDTGNNRDAEILGKADANEIIETYEDKDIEARANELAIKRKRGKTTARENAEFFRLGEYLTVKLEEKELKESGVDTSILQNKEFKAFANNFKTGTKISDVYKIWKKMNGEEDKTPEKPASTGSSQSTVPDNKEKEYYTPEEVDKLSSKDLDNPTIWKRVRESMKRWK